MSADGRALADASCSGAVMVPLNIEHLPQAVQSCASPSAPGVWSTIKEFLD
jgi:hypothetical protein